MKTLTVGTNIGFSYFLAPFVWDLIFLFWVFLYSRYDLHSGIHDSIGNHNDISMCVGYSYETTTNPGSFNNSVAGQQDNIFIISNFKSKYPVLQLDLRLISVLVVVIVSATCGGIAFACAGQPTDTYIHKFSGPLIFERASHQEKIKNVMFFCVVSLWQANWDQSQRALHVYHFQGETRMGVEVERLHGTDSKIIQKDEKKI
ncbi:uncharacterized protein LOC126622442 isoform X2 [Malus sylvestris]|uniref:uncharacterized protein LOC126622442 isoform X2 n=1 Tax=Malus sylvestris TaxID=3752 RepID=UPI0021ABB8FC|nr:uncharacterized protein LOC126622442 isoform X2 [Malus sylvestris]